MLPSQSFELLAETMQVPRWGIGLVVAALGLALLMPHATKAARGVGAALAAIGMGFIFASLPWEASILTKSLFYVLSAITLAAAVGAVCSRAALYCAIWFAGSLLGVAGLLVLAEAQFLGVATIVVYAGAIVVTFLFVIMLAQPRGNESYDRVSWGSLSKPFAIFAAAALIAASIFSQQAAVTGSLREQVADLFLKVPESADYPAILPADVIAASKTTEGSTPTLEITLRPGVLPPFETHASEAAEQNALDQQNNALRAREVALSKALSQVADEQGLQDFEAGRTKVTFTSGLAINDTQTTRHVEAFGVNLFGNQLVAVQIAGVLLLVALVGAISILTHDAPAASSSVPSRSEAAV